MYESPPPLKFPSLVILRRLTKRIQDELAAEENEILQSKRANLIIRQFDGGINSSSSNASSQKGKRKQKVSNACQNCKKSKKCCDGYLPCDYCSKRSKHCEYPPGVSAPPRPVSDHNAIITTTTTTYPLPTPTEPNAPIIMSHDDNTSSKPQKFIMGRFSTQQQQRQAPAQHFFPTPESVTLVTENSVNPSSSTAALGSGSEQGPQPCTDGYGHFTGDTAFFIPQQSSPLPAGPTSSLPRRPVIPQFLSADIQTSLIDTFYAHANPFFPAIMSKGQMLAELQQLRTDQPSQLSRLFFHAVFSRAASLTSGEDFVQQQDTAAPIKKTWASISDTLLTSAFETRDDYLEVPHISTLLALVIMANHFEHNKLSRNLRKAWVLIGDAGRLAIDMGLHRALRLLMNPEEDDDVYAQMCIRTFWVVCVSERTMSITYGRPSMFDDKDIDVPPPKRLPTDDDHTKDWVESLRQLVIMSNISCRIMRFNYAAQTQFTGPLRVNAAASTIDCWMCMESDSNLEDRLLEGLEPTTAIDSRKKRLNDLEAFYFFSNLIQLHKPFMHQDNHSKGNEPGRPSFNICHLAAIAISHITYTAPIAELADLCKSPPVLYAIAKALHVHLENASHPGESDKTIAFSEISFERTLSQLRKLPAIIHHPNNSSMLTATLNLMEQKYYQRTHTVVAGYLVSKHHVDSPVPTLCSSNEASTVASVSSVDGAPNNLCNNNNNNNSYNTPPVSLPSSSPAIVVPSQQKQQQRQQGYDWSATNNNIAVASNNITFVTVDPAIKSNTTPLGKRKPREATSIITKRPSPTSTSNNNKAQTSQSRKAQEPSLHLPTSTISTSTILTTTSNNMDLHQQQQQERQLALQSDPSNNFFSFVTPMNNDFIFQQQQQQTFTMPMTNTNNNPTTITTFDTHPSLYPETHLIPQQRLEQDPDLPSAILGEELWSTANNGYC
ncbi:hypothetical protein BDA99DRAFT_562019 [Phascolomyces articulosus]|uniref:Zn(2)-C6 fungal-type domain-containing protein n=1 Tax=Phascolomyces articulosus TaxID=60185 RepID=A0AAD5PBP6_9FUNG|nr:hypothetical protein BDA99DRAFT_562019 [Phascolomyces articulosus]